MHQRSRLRRVPGLFVGQPNGRELAQLVVDQRQQLLRGVRVALLDGRQDTGNLAHSIEDNCPEGGEQERMQLQGEQACALRSRRPRGAQAVTGRIAAALSTGNRCNRSSEG